MMVFGQLCLLISLVGSGYAAFACVAGGLKRSPRLVRGGHYAALASAAGLSIVAIILFWALAAKDFRFAYVADYSSRSLPWRYSLSALWVGQAGSLLLWAWFLAALALLFRYWPGRETPTDLRDSAFGIAMGCLCFLLLIMVFAADPMQPTRAVPREGAGLSPLLQHPSMLIHPPVVFLGYAGWSIPFSMAVAALLSGRFEQGWLLAIRRWALFSFAVLGAGILLGAQWAYEELGWGGYWGWDPVENGSLIPWLTGGAMIHALMAWRHCGVLKKTSLALTIVTFGLCNFATFLTRSGVFSSVHAFSQSPIGWMFLAFMAALIVGGAVLLTWRRRLLVAARSISAVTTREALAAVSVLLLVVLAVVVVAGTLMGVLSTFAWGKTVLVGPPFYNNVLLPVGLFQLAMIAVVPLLRWRARPTKGQRNMFVLALSAASIASILFWFRGVREPITLFTISLAVLLVFTTGGATWLDARRRRIGSPRRLRLGVLAGNRRQSAGYLIHIGLAGLAVGIAGSSLNAARHEAAMDEGDAIRWAGREIRYLRLHQRELPDKLVAEAELEIRRPDKQPVSLLPARHYYALQNQWTTEVAIHSDWSGDLYVILHAGEGGGRITLSFLENPLMRWIWLGGGVMAAGSLIAIWPERKRAFVGHADRRPRCEENVPPRQAA